MEMRRLLALLLVLPCLAGCRDDSEEAQRARLETVDVAPALEIDPADDTTAVQRPAALVGVLPKGFPDDMPLYLPASLVDWGSGAGGRYVNLLTPHGQARVEPRLTSLIRDGGWTVTRTGEGWLLRKGVQRVRLWIEDARPGTLYRFEY